MDELSQQEFDTMLEEHHKWLNGDGGQRLQLDEYDLRKVNLDQDISFAVLTNCDLRKKTIGTCQGANFSGSDLSGTMVKDIKETATLDGARLEDTDFIGAFPMGDIEPTQEFEKRADIEDSDIDIDDMDISVIVPAWHADWCLGRCLRSIAGQDLEVYEVLVGIDACEDTLEAFDDAVPNLIQDKVKGFYFPEHVGCYPIRNTLAMLASGNVLFFFDADDLMLPHYTKSMAELTEPGTQVRGLSEDRREGTEEIVEKEHRSVGQFSIWKKDFLELKGFEPWVCSADKEFAQRVSKSGMTTKRVQEVNHVRYKHGGNLTEREETNEQSHLRKDTRVEINRRKSKQIERPFIHTADPRPIADKTAGAWMDKRVVDWCLIRRCNYRCSYCFADKNNIELPWEQVKTIADNIKRFPEKSVNVRITGGEPTLYEHYRKLIGELLKDERIHVTCLTNMTANPDVWKGLPKDRVDIIASYHSEHADREEFRRKVNTVDLPCRVWILARPDGMDEVKSLKENFENSEVKIIRKGGRPSPEYTQDNLDWISVQPEQEQVEINGEQLGLNQATAQKRNCFKGWTCIAGTQKTQILETGKAKALTCQSSHGETIDMTDPDEDIFSIIHPVTCHKKQCNCLSELPILKWDGQVEEHDKPDQIECPICGWTGNELAPYGRHRRIAGCPNCNTAERHRLLWLFLKNETFIFDDEYRVLDIAPNDVLRRKFRSMDNLNYVCGDIDGKRGSILDVTDLGFADGSFDVIFCYHVLEHIFNDYSAIQELCRVMKPDGFGIIQSHQYPGYPSTIEGDGNESDMERRERFGQKDHWRIYGEDYPDRLSESGFNVEVVDYVDLLGPQVADRYKLDKSEKLYICRK